jgi:hypothetical protein
MANADARSYIPLRQRRTKTTKKLLLAACAVCVLVAPASASDLYVIISGPAGKLCRPSELSFGDVFKAFSQLAAEHGQPQPQVDYTTGASAGATFLRWVNPTTGEPRVGVYFTDLALCEAGAARINERFGQ